MRVFIILYPALGIEEEQSVVVLPGETPDEAIMREGDALHEFVVIRELL